MSPKFLFLHNFKWLKYNFSKELKWNLTQFLYGVGGDLYRTHNWLKLRLHSYEISVPSHCVTTINPPPDTLTIEAQGTPGRRVWHACKSQSSGKTDAQGCIPDQPLSFRAHNTNSNQSTWGPVGSWWHWVRISLFSVWLMTPSLSSLTHGIWVALIRFRLF